MLLKNTKLVELMAWIAKIDCSRKYNF